MSAPKLLDHVNATFIGAAYADGKYNERPRVPRPVVQTVLDPGRHFAMSLRRSREKMGASVHDVANNVGATKREVRSWEDAAALPTREQFTKLQAMFRELQTPALNQLRTSLVQRDVAPPPPPAFDADDVQVLLDVLAAIDLDVPRDVVAKWKPEARALVEEWASAEHLRRSEGEHVHVPLPPSLIRPYLPLPAPAPLVALVPDPPPALEPPAEPAPSSAEPPPDDTAAPSVALEPVALPDVLEPPPSAPASRREPPMIPALRPRSFGERLRACREGEGLRQEDAAPLLNVAQSTWSAWELDTVVPVADHYAKLLDLFPALAGAPKPRVRAIPKPVGSTGGRTTPVPEEPEMNQPPPLRAVPTAGEPSALFVEHRFMLRRGVYITVMLPVDLTVRDVERTKRWLDTLPLPDAE